MDKKELISLHESASPELRDALEKEFGELFFNDNIDTVERAEKYLGLEYTYLLFSSMHENYYESVMAFYKLRVLCDAWNKQDGFVPVFDDLSQGKWFPVFSGAGCGFSYSTSAPSHAYSYIGSRLCFKSKERSNEFGKKFEELFKIFLRG